MITYQGHSKQGKATQYQLRRLTFSPFQRRSHVSATHADAFFIFGTCDKPLQADTMTSGVSTHSTSQSQLRLPVSSKTEQREGSLESFRPHDGLVIAKELGFQNFI